ncbi:hypothetical protein SAMN04488102_101371 [Alkalibacterium subtropicum]|uniref:Uncharacterized protein n=1 Tax=Alkalibacterium subtropicum TaxID=753702 RepID=A0A1I1EVH6_9LACT|nr:CD1375 family protein [Alkalibacterium subtropicum]SFB90977.1 hypothetical protein SAMN04488102_101371 [Alkalibacterium subtropicum]
MNEILINSLAVRIKAGLMTLEQVPPVYRDAVEARLEEIEGDRKLEVVEEETGKGAEDERNVEETETVEQIKTK